MCHNWQDGAQRRNPKEQWLKHIQGSVDCAETLHIDA
jgi:hypothetical protein